MPAGSAEPWLRTQLQPRSIRRPFRHETQNMPLCWALAQPGLWPAPLTTPARTSGGRPRTASENSRGQTRGCLLPGAGRACFRRGDGREGFPAAGMRRRPGNRRCSLRGPTRHLGPLLSGCTVRPRRGWLELRVSSVTPPLAYPNITFRRRDREHLRRRQPPRRAGPLPAVCGVRGLQRRHRQRDARRVLRRRRRAGPARFRSTTTSPRPMSSSPTSRGRSTARQREPPRLPPRLPRSQRRSSR